MVALPGQNLTFHSTHAILQLRPRTKIVYMHMFVGKIQALCTAATMAGELGVRL